MPDRITELNEELWDSRAANYDRAFRFNRRVQKKVISLIALTDDTRLLEIACGTGWALRYAAGLAGRRGEFYGVDLASRMLARAEQNSAAYENIHFVRADAGKLPFHDGFFTVIICTNAFHHFSNPGAVIQESARVLKSTGKVYIADPAGDTIIAKTFDRLQRKLQPAHVKTYSTSEYQTFFQEAKLSYLEHRTIIPTLKVHAGEKR